MDDEIWRDIIDYDGLYKVSSLGNIKSLPRNGTISIERELSGLYTKGGYLRVCLQKNGNKKYIQISNLVAKAFPEICGEWFDGCQVDHLNTIRTDNRAINLKVCTAKENSNNPLTLLHKSLANIGEKNPNFGKPLSEETKRKISDKLKGILHPLFGKHHTEETKKKISEAHKGLGAKQVYQYDKDLNLIKIWNSAQECEKYGFTSSNICLCCNGKRPHYKSFIWSYKELNKESV